MIRLHHTVIGDPHKPLVFFCHGLLGQGKNWTSIAKDISDEFCSVLLDMPNHGRSAWTETISYPDMADHVAAWVTTKFPDALPARWVGHSMGGKIVMRLALTRPEIVERLCVVDMSPAKTGAMIAFDPIFDGIEKVDLATVTSRAQIQQIVGTEVRDAVVRSFLMQNVHQHHGVFHWQPNMVLLSASREILSDWPPINATYAGKVAWISGATSNYVRHGNARGMRTLFPNVEHTVVPGAGHWVHSEQPELFTQTLREFLSQP